MIHFDWYYFDRSQLCHLIILLPTYYCISVNISFFCTKKEPTYRENGVDSFFLIQIIHITDTSIIRLSESIVQCS